MTCMEYCTVTKSIKLVNNDYCSSLNYWLIWIYFEHLHKTIVYYLRFVESNEEYRTKEPLSNKAQCKEPK